MRGEDAAQGGIEVGADSGRAMPFELGNGRFVAANDGTYNNPMHCLRS